MAWPGVAWLGTASQGHARHGTVLTNEEFSDRQLTSSERSGEERGEVIYYVPRFVWRAALRLFEAAESAWAWAFWKSERHTEWAWDWLASELRDYKPMDRLHRWLCEMNGHGSVVFYKPYGLEPDMHCRRCGEDLGFRVKRSGEERVK